MLNDTQIEALAAQLVDAEERRYQIAALTVSHPDMTLDEAYASRSAGWIEKLRPAGRSRATKSG